MRRKNQNTEQPNSIYSIELKPIDHEKVKELLLSHDSGPVTYEERFCFVSQLAQFLSIEFEKEIDKIDFTNDSLTTIENKLIGMFLKYHNTPLLDTHISYVYPDFFQFKIMVDYTKSYTFTQPILPRLISENFSQEILESFAYIKQVLEVPVMDYVEQTLEYFQDFESAENSETGSNEGFTKTIYDYTYGIPGMFNKAIDLKPQLTIQQCIDGISDETIKTLLKLALDGFSFTGNTDNLSEDGVFPHEYIFFFWDYFDYDDITRFHCEGLDQNLGNNGFMEITKEYYIKPKEAKNKIEIDTQLVTFLNAMK